MSAVPCYIASVIMDERQDRQQVCIKSIDGDAELAMAIGQTEAMAIERAMHEEGFPRPLTHDLLANTITAHGSSLSAVVIIREDQGTYFAELRITTADGGVLAIDCRPSDGLALQTRTAGCQLLVDESLFA